LPGAYCCGTAQAVGEGEGRYKMKGETVPLEFTCACGTKCRIDLESNTGPGMMPSVKHCVTSEAMSLPAKPKAFLRGEVWQLGSRAGLVKPPVKQSEIKACFG